MPKPVLSIFGPLEIDREEALFNTEGLPRPTQQKCYSIEALTQNTPNTWDGRITLVVDFINLNYAQELDVHGLASQVCLSPSRLAHLFKLTTGCSLMKYLKGVRLRQAKILLEQNKLSVKCVMASVNISDISHFVRDFRRAYGVTPKDTKLALRTSQNRSRNG
jgi:AraC family transcriptional regulator of arabinose operon